jgi:catechol 2,3-dioxygenase-like lactoylglutathione lyase family enzyme
VRIHHLAFRTTDLTRLERFYAGVLGLEVLRRDGSRSVWLDAGGAIVMLERREDGEPAVDQASMELTCFAVAPRDAPAFLERLAEAGVPIEGRTAFSVYFRDPDGRRIGLSAYPESLA